MRMVVAKIDERRKTSFKLNGDIVIEQNECGCLASKE